LSIKKLSQDFDGKTISCKLSNEIGSTETSTVIQAKSSQSEEIKHEEAEAVQEIPIQKYEKTEIEEKSSVHQKSPAFTQTIQDALVENGQTAKFEVKTCGEPEPEISWFLNGQEVQESTNVKIYQKEKGVHVLEIRNVSKILL